MATARSGTKDYPDDARQRLARAVIAAREAAGYTSRPKFVAAATDVNGKSLDLLERGEPGVGGKVLRAIGRALPGWTDDTPWDILEGADPPPVPVQAPRPRIPGGEGGRTGPIDLAMVAPEMRREIVRQSIRGLELFRKSEEAYEQYIEAAIDLAIQLGRLEAADQHRAMGESVRQAG